MTTLDPRSVLYGDKTDGIELRHDDGTEGPLDEVIVYVGGKVIVHLEKMSDVSFWMGLYAGGFRADVNIGAKNNRSHVQATGDAYEE